MGGWIFAEVPPSSIFVVMGMVTKSEQLYASVTYVYCQHKKNPLQGTSTPREDFVNTMAVSFNVRRLNNHEGATREMTMKTPRHIGKLPRREAGVNSFLEKIF